MTTPTLTPIQQKLERIFDKFFEEFANEEYFVDPDLLYEIEKSENEIEDKLENQIKKDRDAVKYIRED